LIGGVPERVVGRQFQISKSSVHRHRLDHIIRPAQHKLKILGRSSEVATRKALAEAAASNAELPLDQFIEAAVGTRALLDEHMDIRGSLRRNRQQAEEKGMHRDVASLAGQEIHNLEFGARVGGHPAFRSASAPPPSHEAGARWSIQMIFQQAKRVDEVGGPIIATIDRDKIDPTATDGMDVPSPHPKTKVTRDLEGKTVVPYWGYEKLPDKPADDTEDD
jgi:hypothetical protein